ncbi:MAG TPA: hypothetical protein VI756_03835 [Blastocatellia bacterium]
MELEYCTQEARQSGTGWRQEDGSLGQCIRVPVLGCRNRKFIYILVILLLTTTPMAARASASKPPFALIVQEGDAAPPAVGGLYSKIVSASIDDSDAVTFSANLAGSAVSSAIFIASGGVTQTVLKAGDAAPGGGVYESFLEVDRAYAAEATPPFAFLMFHATLQGGSSPEGLFVIVPDGSVQAIALTGGLSPFGFHYQSFSNPSVLTLPARPEDPSESSSYYAVFTAWMAEGNQSIVFFWFGIGGEFTTGETIGEEAPSIGFMISRAGSVGGFQGALGTVIEFLPASGAGIKRAVLWSANSADGSFSYGSGARTGGVTQDGTIKDIPGPPAMSSGTMAMQIVFRGGRTALALFQDVFTSQAASGLSIVAMQGERAPGLHGFKVKSFGPPVGNDGQTQGPSTAPAILSDSRPWLG